MLVPVIEFRPANNRPLLEETTVTLAATMRLVRKHGWNECIAAAIAGQVCTLMLDNLYGILPIPSFTFVLIICCCVAALWRVG